MFVCGSIVGNGYILPGDLVDTRKYKFTPKQSSPHQTWLKREWRHHRSKTLAIFATNIMLSLQVWPFDKKIYSKDVRPKLYSRTANLIVFTHGCLVAWVTPVLPLLKSNDTPLTTGPLSMEEVSWLVSLGSLGSMFAALPIRSVTNRVGCKRMMISYLAVLTTVSGVPAACITISLRNLLIPSF